MARNFASASNNFIDCGSGLAPGTSNFSYGCWFKTTASTYSLIAKSLFGAAVGRFYLANTGGTGLQAGWTDSAGNGLSTGSVTGLSDGNWHQATVTVNRTGNLLLYVDGTLQQTSSISANSTVSWTTTDHLLFGAYNDASGGTSGGVNFPLNGSMAEVFFIQRILSANEVKTLTRFKPSRLGTLWRYWPLDGLASPEVDLSGSANNGTLSGTTRANHAPVTLFARRQPYTQFDIAAVIVPCAAAGASASLASTGVILVSAKIASSGVSGTSGNSPLIRNVPFQSQGKTASAGSSVLWAARNMRAEGDSSSSLAFGSVLGISMLLTASGASGASADHATLTVSRPFQKISPRAVTIIDTSEFTGSAKIARRTA